MNLKLRKLLWIAMLALSAGKLFAQSELVFVGSGRRDISAFRLDLTSGALHPMGKVAQIKAPSFLAISPDQKYLYAISEGVGLDDSAVSAFRLDDQTGALTPINRRLTGGAGPCHVTVDQTGKDVLVANYNSGSFSVFPIDSGGALGVRTAFIQDHGSSVNPARQEGPHAHCIVTGPDDQFAFGCDLGLDKVMIFKFNPAKGTLVANDPAFAPVKAGLGPRHIAFHPNHRFAYVISEMGGTVTGFSFDSQSGTFSEIENHKLPKRFEGDSWAAEVAVHPSGKFVFASNRGDDSIDVYACDPETGRLTFIERDPTQGKNPRHFEIDPSGNFLLAANQDSGTIVVFRIDIPTGHLQPTRNVAKTDKPMCVKCLKPVGIHSP